MYNVCVLCKPQRNSFGYNMHATIIICIVKVMYMYVAKPQPHDHSFGYSTCTHAAIIAGFTYTEAEPN